MDINTCIISNIREQERNVWYKKINLLKVFCGGVVLNKHKACSWIGDHKIFHYFLITVPGENLRMFFFFNAALHKV